jgi:hypothetical protein
MTKLYYLYKADNPLKRYKIYIANPITDKIKKIEFGSSVHENYNIHGDKERLKRYIQRHKKRENWKDWTTPGFYSRWLLWNEKSRNIQQNLKWIMKNFINK